jgi:hypothetical protein
MYKFFKNYIVFIFSLIVFIFVIEYYFPGFSSPDCLRQSVQAILNTYRLDHPPIMAYLIHLFMNLFNKQEVYFFFIFEISIYLLGLFLIAKKQKSILLGLFIIISCVLNPLVFRFLGYIEKDILMISSYVLFVGILFHIDGYKEFKYKVLIFLELVLLFLGTASRHNAVFPAFFLVMMLIYRIQYNSILKLIYKTIIIWIFLILFINFFNTKIIKAEHSRSIPTEIMFSDICAINYTKKTFDFPTCINFSKEYFYKNYRFNVATEGSYHIWKTIPNNSETTKNIKEYWQKMIFNNFVEYIYVKSIFFKRMLFNYGEWTESIQAKVKNKFGQVGFNFIFVFTSPFIHILILFLLLFYKLFKIKKVYNNKDDFIFFVLIISGIFYCLPYFFICCAYDYRYSLWYIIVSYISLAWVVSDYVTIKKEVFKFSFNYVIYICLGILFFLSIRAVIFDKKIDSIIKNSKNNLEWNFKDKLENKNYFLEWYRLNLQNDIYNYYKINAYINFEKNEIIFLNKKPFFYIHRASKTFYQKNISTDLEKQMNEIVKKESFLGRIQSIYLDKKTSTQFKVQYCFEIEFFDENNVLVRKKFFEVKTTCLYPRIQVPIFSKYFIYDVSKIDIANNVSKVKIKLMTDTGEVIQ